MQTSSTVFRHFLRLSTAALLLAVPGIEAAAGSLIVRTGEAVGDDIRDIASVGLHSRYSESGWTRTVTDDGGSETVVPGRAAVAMIRSGGHVSLSTWDVSHTGEVESADSEDGDFSASVIAVAAINPARVFTAARVSTDDRLRLTAWDIDTDGDIERRGSFLAGAISGVSMAPLDEAPNGKSCRLVTFTTNPSGAGKLIVWKYTYETGSFERLSEIAAGVGSFPRVINLAPGRVAIGYQSATGLQLQVWDIPQGGVPRSLGRDVDPQGGLHLSMTLAGRNRIVTAHTVPGNQMRINTWNLRLDSGKLNHANSLNVAGQDAASVAPLGGGTKIVTAAQTSGGRLVVSTWGVVGSDIEPLHSLLGGKAERTHVVAIWADRFATPLRQDDGRLKVIAWNDLSVGLVHGQWPPSMVVAPLPGRPSLALAQARRDPRSAHEVDEDHEAQQRRQFAALRPAAAAADRAPNLLPQAREVAAPSSPAASLSVTFPDMGAKDPMVAVGHSFLMVSDTGRIRFLDRQGQVLTLPGGAEANLSTAEFFADLTRYSVAVPNRSNFHLYQTYPPYTHRNCDMLANPVDGPCVRTFYDTRVGYSERHRRFFAVAAVRPSDTGGDLFYTSMPRYYYEPIAGRYVAFALSRTENPLDGFNLWMTTESSLRDWPFGEVSGNAFLVSYKGKGDTARNSARALVFSIEDMLAGRKYLHSWRIYQNEIDGESFAPVVTPDGDTGDTSLYVRIDGSGIVYFDQPANDWSRKPTIRTASIDGVDLRGFGMGATLRGGALYMAGVRPLSSAVANAWPRQWGVVVLKVTLAKNGAGRYDDVPVLSGRVKMTTLDEGAPGDPRGSTFSYEAPSVAVNSRGDWMVSFARVQTGGTGPLPQEARYALWRQGQGLLQSSLLRLGDAPYLRAVVGASKRTLVSYVSDDRYCLLSLPSCTCPNDSPNCDKPKIDYAFAAADPADGLGFWMAHGIPLNGADGKMQGFRLVLGQIPAAK